MKEDLLNIEFNSQISSEVWVKYTNVIAQQLTTSGDRIFYKDEIEHDPKRHTEGSPMDRGINAKILPKFGTGYPDTWHKL
ncbi:hypothetical protein [Algoriphagus faecimaris]|uniref:hypothetical protein n=1 Tax=Algoriphagus faecimaris TaxID=686796 RepID=UPI000B4301A2|nr:hypothetical protein [Algoriphagus faecimaris]